MRILFLGDVVGNVGCNKIIDNLENQIKKNEIDFVVVNGENADESGVGLTQKICEDFFFKCKLLKKVGYAFCLRQYLTSYRIRKNSLQSSNLKNFYWIWKINKKYNKLSILDNLISLLYISINSLKKYGGKNIF